MNVPTMKLSLLCKMNFYFSSCIACLNRTVYKYLGSDWFSSVPPSKYQDNTVKQDMISTFHTLTKSLLIVILSFFIWICITSLESFELQSDFDIRYYGRPFLDWYGLRFSTTLRNVFVIEMRDTVLFSVVQTVLLNIDLYCAYGPEHTYSHPTYVKPSCILPYPMLSFARLGWVYFKLR
jgi:hypothetical protein